MRFSVENWSKKVFSRKNVGYGRYGRYVGYGRYKLENSVEIDPQEKSARSFLRVVFDADSRGDLCFYPFCGLGVEPIEYTAIDSGGRPECSA